MKTYYFVLCIANIHSGKIFFSKNTGGSRWDICAGEALLRAVGGCLREDDPSGGVFEYSQRARLTAEPFVNEAGVLASVSSALVNTVWSRRHDEQEEIISSGPSTTSSEDVSDNTGIVIQMNEKNENYTKKRKTVSSEDGVVCCDKVSTTGSDKISCEY